MTFGPRAVAVLGVAAIAGGCTTHLEAVRADPQQPETRHGIAYFLPFTQFDLTASWTVVDCKGALRLAPTISAAARTTPDPRHLYTIDYRSLDAWTKTSSVKVDFYDSGAIKAINAAADDRTGEIAASAIRTVGKIVGFGAVGWKGAAPQCSAGVKAQLRKIEAKSVEVERLTRAVEAATAALDALTARIVRSAGAASKTFLDAQERQAAVVVSTQMGLALAASELAGLHGEVSYSVQGKFPRDSEDVRAFKAVVPTSVWRQWIENASAMAGAGSDPEAALASFQIETAIFVELASDRDWQAGRSEPETNRKAGIRYRVAVPATLEGCMAAACSTPLTAAIQPERIDSIPVRLLQNGSTFFLPFQSAPFTNASLTATFSEAGVLKSAGYEQKRARGEALLTVAEQLADQIATVGGKIREAHPTELETIKHQTELTTARTALADARKAQDAAPNGAALSQSAAWQADTTLKTAEIANIQAEIALRKAKDERDAAFHSD